MFLADGVVLQMKKKGKVVIGFYLRCNQVERAKRFLGHYITEMGLKWALDYITQCFSLCLCLGI